MKKPLLGLLSVCLLSTLGCQVERSDSHESVLRQMSAVLNAMADTLSKIKDVPTLETGYPQVVTLVEQWRDLNRRLAVVKAPPRNDQERVLLNVHESSVKIAKKHVLAHVNRIHQSRIEPWAKALLDEFGELWDSRAFFYLLEQPPVEYDENGEEILGRRRNRAPVEMVPLDVRP